MKIQGFNPQITKEQFTEALKTKSAAELKSVVFAALSTNSLSQLTEGLEAHTVKQIEDFAEERTTQIAKTIRLFINLGDQRDDLVTTCPAFKQGKSAMKQARAAGLDLYRLDTESFKEIISQNQNAGWFTKLKQLEELATREYSNCISQNPIVRVNDALNHCEKSDDNGKESAQIDALCSALTYFVLEEPKAELEYVAAWGGSRTSYQLEVLKEQFPKAQEKAKEILDKRTKEKPGKIQSAKDNLIKNLELYQETRQVVLTDSGYANYVKAKDVAYNALREVAPFCSRNELSHHPKTSNELQNKFYRICQVNVTKS